MQLHGCCTAPMVDGVVLLSLLLLKFWTSALKGIKTRESRDRVCSSIFSFRIRNSWIRTWILDLSSDWRVSLAASSSNRIETAILFEMSPCAVYLATTYPDCCWKCWNTGSGEMWIGRRLLGRSKLRRRRRSRMWKQKNEGSWSWSRHPGSCSCRCPYRCCVGRPGSRIGSQQSTISCRNSMVTVKEKSSNRGEGGGSA